MNPEQHEDSELLARRLAAIVDSSDDAIVGKNLQSIITSWNAGAQRIFGYSPEEMIGSSIMRLIPIERHAEEEEILSRIRAGQRVEHFETIRVTKDGRLIHVSISVSPIKDSTGRIVGASKIARDVSDRKEAEELLRAAAIERQRLLESEQAARSQLERANRIKDEFLATVSHELRTPLNAILGWANVLKTGHVKGPDLVQGLDTIERNARSQAQIIDDLLDMSRIISGKVRLEVQRVDLPTILNEAVETVRTAASAKNIQLQVIMDPLQGTVAGDPSRLQQIFWNLLTNAIKFTPKDGRVQVLLERVNSHVEISIIDTGEGIAPEFLPLVFDRFAQGDASTTRRHGGLGIGLAIVKQLVELHGGTVRAKSHGIGQGSAFIVHLPVASVHHGSESRTHPKSGTVDTPPPSPFVSLDGVTVLVIDDEPDARLLVKRLLDMAHATVIPASSAAEGLRLLDEQTPDILICDIGMPDEDGYSFIRKVRALENSGKRDIPAIALTAYARLEDRTHAISAGFHYHLAKPVEPAELLAVVDRLANKRRKS